MESLRGHVDENMGRHIRLIITALSYEADLIVFPELSLTGYEPGLSKTLATHQDDKRFDIFQVISDTENICICSGIPTNGSSGILISMLVFQPGLPRQSYSKRFLHADELPFFVQGGKQLYIETDTKRIAPAICYESLLPEHAEEVFENGAEVYLTSVAKSAKGVAKAHKHYANTAKKYGMPVIMSNCIGFCDNFESAGKSAIWNKNGQQIGSLNESNEGLLIFDTETEEIIRWTGLEKRPGTF